MSQATAPVDWTATPQIRWCQDQVTNPDGSTSCTPHLEQWYVDASGNGGWFMVPSVIEG